MKNKTKDISELDFPKTLENISIFLDKTGGLKDEINTAKKKLAAVKKAIHLGEEGNKFFRFGGLISTLYSSKFFNTQEIEELFVYIE